MGSATSGVGTGTEPPVGSGAKPPKHEKYAGNLIECHKFQTVQTKKFQLGNFGGGHVPLVPLPYTLGPLPKKQNYIMTRCVNVSLYTNKFNVFVFVHV